MCLLTHKQQMVIFYNKHIQSLPPVPAEKQTPAKIQHGCHEVKFDVDLRTLFEDVDSHDHFSVMAVFFLGFNLKNRTTPSMLAYVAKTHWGEKHNLDSLTHLYSSKSILCINNCSILCSVGPQSTHIPPSCDSVWIEVLGYPSKLVLGSSIMSSHGGLLMVLLQGKRYLILY